MYVWWQNNIKNEIFGDNLITNFIKKKVKKCGAQVVACSRGCASPCVQGPPANHLANSNESFKQLANH